MDFLRDNPIASLIVTIIAVVGGVVVIIEPATLSFAEYVQNVGIAAGLLAIGRGLKDGLARR